MKSLTNLSIVRLQVLEVGQHVKSVSKGIETLGSSFITDAVLTNYLAKVGDASAEFDKAMLRIKKSDETAKIVTADAVRDKAITATQRYLSVFELSDNEAELTAFASLNTVFNTYKGIQKWNFEEETNGLDNLLTELATSKYQPAVTALNMQNYVARMAAANEVFKVLFAGRTTEQANKEHYDTKALRDDLTQKYNTLIEYVLVMAKATNEEQYNKPLDVINTVRKYYADLLAKRKGTSKTTEEPIPPME